MSHKADLDESQSGSCTHGRPGKDCNQCYGKYPVYKENCGPKVCSLPCDGVNPYALYVKKRDAVVRITASTTLTTVTNPCARVCDDHSCPNPCVTSPCAGDQVYNFNQNIALLQQSSNGFFIANHLILAPASIALLSPDITTIYNRYPFSANQIDPTTLHGDRITRAASFTADVFNVNGSGYTLNYNLELLGVYGLGDVALFWINRDDPVNRKLPCIKKCHPFFEIGCSRRYRSGLPVYAIGDAGARSWPDLPVGVPAGGLTGSSRATVQSALEGISGSNSFLAGSVQKISYADYGGFAQQELILVSLPVSAYKTGLPLINQWGQVIGMQTTTDAHNSANITVAQSQAFPQTLAPNGDGFVAGPSSFSFGRVIQHIFQTLQGASSPFVQPVADDFGVYLLYTHGYLGVSTQPFTGQMYTSYVNSAGLTVPRYDSTGVGLANVGPREVIGVRVRALAGAVGGIDIAPAGVVVPGPPTAGTAYFPPSPLAGLVTYNDVLVRIDGQPLGGNEDQIPLAVMTSRRLPGEAVTLCYRRNCEDYVKTYAAKAVLQQLPNFMNYPWYKYPTLTVALRDLQPLNGANFLSLLPVVPPVSGTTSFLPAV